MILKKLKSLLAEYRYNHKTLFRHNKELEWAHIYHDSIRGIFYFERLSLNIGRWAGNYTFFYLLNRILHDYKPKKILELGLGESSKLVSTYSANASYELQHVIIEQNEKWLESFSERFNINETSQVIVCPLIQKNVKGFEVNHYGDLSNHIGDSFHLYIIDGPYGSKRYSRYDLIYLAGLIKKEDHFIILFDDCDRRGEKDTLDDLIALFHEKRIPIFTKLYVGSKTVALVASIDNEFINSL